MPEPGPTLETPRRPRKGDLVELEIEAFDERGQGLARHAGHTVALRRAIPGERVRAQVLRRRGEQLLARVVERLAPSALAVAPRCAHFGSCGGCSFQNLDYAAQLAGKRRLVEQAFAAQGFAPEIEPVLAAPAQYAYRNKMEFSFGTRRWVDPSEPPDAPQGFALGLHARELYSKVIDVQACPIQPASADAILASLRQLALEQGLEPWDLRTHTGLLRHVLFRIAHGTREILVDLVTSRDAPELVEPLARALLARHPEITTLVQNVNSRAAQTAFGERERVLHGPGFVIERLLGLEFAVSANSFFQTNTAQAERLFTIVREEAALAGHERVWDLYCGAGTIALVLAAAAREVTGFELAPSAVADARANAERNGVLNTSFVEGDVLASLAACAGAPDLAVVDPPRAGLHARVVETLVRLAPARLVYVSCNPSSAARDARAFAERGWRLGRVRPLDLFPHTPHVECVFALERPA